MLSRRMLSREEEEEIGEEKEVRKEDQDKINRFSRIHSRHKLLEGELKAKQKNKEDLEEISTELELADDDDKVPYKIGDSFFSLPVPEVQELLSSSVEKIDEQVTALEEKMSGLNDEMSELKAALYGRFGRSINLET
ncbi:Prefoldin subunit-domain-containing protein [Neohortaea acidophila]|uniref:Prefoldin subunit 4 n=1 Tax=Neohortaea acidophila TaxID=245834 RepID=A0A6A6Q0F7_9PEZI|nr:Prefoldin subunit-domain-containing protein [Neohortaea acidophila]KAF2485762.1 Prefoldin subunit-domain-containing protein [Neohortaea acidophila]